MTKKYFPLHVHSHFSLLDGLSKPEHIAARLDEIECEGSAITDHGNICGAVQFLKKMKGKKAILGCELYISEHDATVQNENNRKLTHMLVLAKNDNGWKDLIRLTSEANRPENFYYKPRLSIEQLKPFLAEDNLIIFGGHWGSTIADMVMDENGVIDLESIPLQNLIQGLKEAATSSNFYLEAQLVNQDPKSVALVQAMRELGRRFNIPMIATPDSHYAKQEQFIDQHVLLATNLNKTLYQCTDPSFGMSGFFKCHNYHIPSYDEMIAFGNTEEELDNTLELASKCTEYKDIFKSPILPPFATPNGETPDEHMVKLCNEGWDKKILNKVSNIDEYAQRLTYELEVLQGAKLSSYFLIVQDILKYIRSKGWLPGPGRGSAAGCLVSYLMNITAIDPIKHDLYFERFYNAGRNTAERISMPDIDVDVPVTKREQIIAYIKSKFGEDRVSQMVTFQTMKGRGALKDVLRAHSAVTPAEMNIITKFFPEEAKIADELQTMKEEEGESSIIKWTLDNDEKGHLKEWCSIDTQGNLSGPLSRFFAQAIRLEGTKASQSKHAAGILIAPEALTNICPMVYDSKGKRLIAGLEMNDAEEIGMIKYDILGVAMLDKVAGVADILLKGDIEDELS